MFGSIMKATSSLFTTTSGRLFGKSADNAVSSATNFAEAIKSEADALYNGASAVVKVVSTFATIGGAMLAVGPLVGVGVSVAGTLGVVNGTLGLFTLGSGAVASIQAALIEGSVFIVRHSTQAVLGGGVVGGIYNGRKLLEGVSEAAYAVKKTVDALSYLSHATIDGVKATVYTTAALGLKVVETATRLAGSDQDGFGTPTMVLSELVDLSKDDAELVQKMEKLSEDQDALNKAVDVTNEAISKLKGDNEITAAVKANQEVVRKELLKQQDSLDIRENHLVQREEILKDWNVLTQEKVVNPEVTPLVENLIVELIAPEYVNQQAEAEILGNGEVWDNIDLSSSAVAA